MSLPWTDVIQGAFKGAVAPIANVFSKKIERKQAQDAIKGKVQLAKEQGQTEVSIRASDWEIASKGQEDGTWKDEYITVSVMSIFNAIIVGSIIASFGYSGGAALVEGVLSGIKMVDSMDGTVGTMIEVTVYAGLSIKVIKDLVR